MKTDTFTHPADGKTYHRALCPACLWTSGTLPLQSEAAALHVLKLHGVLCKPVTCR